MAAILLDFALLNPTKNTHDANSISNSSHARASDLQWDEDQSTGSSTDQQTRVPKPIAVKVKRKSHRKSRLGCGNCKLRSVKCDESKPCCKRCSSSGYTCNYLSSSSSSAPALQLAHTGAFSVNLNPSPVTPTTTSATGALSKRTTTSELRGLPSPVPRRPLRYATLGSGRWDSYDLTPSDIGVLRRFATRTMSTMGTRKTRGQLECSALKMVDSYPYLMHICLALTLIHDTHINPSAITPHHRASLAFHWYQGTLLFKHRLSHILPSSAAASSSPRASFSSTEKDALWAAAAILGAAAFGHLEHGDDPASAWPLSEPDAAVDLAWLRMSDGKKAVWEVAETYREDSAFKEMFDSLRKHPLPDGNARILPGTLPVLFHKVFNVGRDSSPGTNAYHHPCALLAQLLPEEMCDDNFVQFLSFITNMDPVYKALLEMRDGKAMLLLVWWYSKTCAHFSWWMRRRSVVEGRAICVYLEKNFGGDEDIMELLEFPKQVLLAL